MRQRALGALFYLFILGLLTVVGAGILRASGMTPMGFLLKTVRAIAGF